MMRNRLASLFVAAAIGVLAWPDVASAASGDGYPSRPVRLITGFAPGGGSDVSAWNGVVVPSAVPPALIARLHPDIVAALRAPEVREVLSNAGGEIVGSSPAEFARFIRKEMATWEKVDKAAGVQR